MSNEAPRHSWWQRPLGKTGWRPASEALDNWRCLFDDLQLEPSVVYAAVREAIQRREIPEVSFSEVVYREKGLLSPGRAYLRVARENHVFDICASPYGRGFFVSWHLAEARPSPLLPTLAAIFYPGLFWLFVAEHAAPERALAYCVLSAFVGLVLLAAVVTQNSGEPWVQYVLVVPYLGHLLESWFLPPTYFRMDSAAMFGESVRRAVKEAVETISQAKGFRIPPDINWKPVMRDLYPR